MNLAEEARNDIYLVSSGINEDDINTPENLQLLLNQRIRNETIYRVQNSTINEFTTQRPRQYTQYVPGTSANLIYTGVFTEQYNSVKTYK